MGHVEYICVSLNYIIAFPQRIGTKRELIWLLSSNYNKTKYVLIIKDLVLHYASKAEAFYSIVPSSSHR